MEQYDVVVVGAGISGLRTSALCAAAGVDVLCLEARGRVGGRLRSLPVPGGVVDLGASWSWPGEHRVAALTAAHGLATHPQHRAGVALLDAPEGVQRFGDNPLDAPARRWSGGAESLARAVAGALPPGVLRLDSPVSALSAEPGALVLRTATGDVRARHVVLALPPSLAVHEIVFAPKLPDPLHELARRTPVWMGATTKVALVYPTPFWREQGLAGSGVSPLGPLRELHDLSGPGGTPAALFGFAAEPPPDAPALLAQLVRMFGAQAGAPQQVLAKDWRQERWTSPPGTAHRQEHRLFGHPGLHAPALDGRLHWAGTETATEAPGHVEGALASAERAAGAALSALGADRRPA